MRSIWNCKLSFTILKLISFIPAVYVKMSIFFLIMVLGPFLNLYLIYGGREMAGSALLDFVVKSGVMK